MHDMLVTLYALPSLEPAVAACAARGVAIRRALAPEKPPVLDWVRAHFASSAAEVETAFAQVPATCFIAVRDDTLLGFACYDVTCRNFFGPEGVSRMSAGAASAARCCWPRSTRNARKATRTRLSVAWVRPSSTPRPWARCRSPIPRRESTQRCCGGARQRDCERELLVRSEKESCRR